MALVHMLYNYLSSTTCHSYTHWWHHQLYCWYTLPFSGAAFSQTGSGSRQDPRYHLCMADPALKRLLSHYQSLRIATSTQQTYQAGIKSLHQFCAQYATLPFPVSPLTQRYFCCYMACQVSYKTIKVYLAGIRLEHLERGFEDPTKDELLQLLCTGIKRSQGTQTRTCLPITITVLQALKSQLCLD